MFSKLTTSLALGAALLLAACAEEPPAADAGAGAGIGDGGAGYGAGQVDPSSIAYFQDLVGDRVYFETDSSRLTAVGMETLGRQAEWLQRNQGVSAVIEGHADERGTRDYNLALGERRAEAARAYLTAQGVSSGRLRTVSYGKERPEALCSDEGCWSVNRRVVTVLAGVPLT